MATNYDQNPSNYSNKVEFVDRDYVRSHGRKPPKFSPDTGAGWAFKVYDYDFGEKIFFTRGVTTREIKREIADHFQAPVGTTIRAFIQP